MLAAAANGYPEKANVSTGVWRRSRTALGKDMPARSRLPYRHTWAAVTGVLALTAMVTIAFGVAHTAPRLAAVLLVAALAVHHIAGLRRSATRLTGVPPVPLTARVAAWPFEARLVAVLAVTLLTGIGLSQVLGSAGVQLLAADVLAALPLLLPADEPTESSWAPWDPAGDTGTSRSTSVQDDDELSLTELCHAWMASSNALDRCIDQERRRLLIVARGQFLDAMTILDPAGVDAWLADPRAATADPRRFLRASRTDAGN